MADGQVTVEIVGDSSKFDTTLKQSRQQAEKFDRQANKAARGGVLKLEKSTRSAARSTKGLSTALRDSADSAAFLTGPLGGVASRLTLVAGAARDGKLALLGAGVAAGTAAAGFGLAVAEAERFRQSNLRIQGVLRATGNASGLTAGEIREFAEGLAFATLESTEGVERAAAQLLTFRTISRDTFKETLSLAADLSALGFGSLEANALRLGKALEDPVQGLGALRRVGVSFNDAQQETIKNLVESNRLFEAQELILEGVARQAGGTAELLGTGLSGALDGLGQRISEFGQGLGEATLKALPLTEAVNFLSDALNKLNDVLFDTPEEELEKLQKELVELESTGVNVAASMQKAFDPNPVIAFGKFLKVVSDGGLDTEKRIETVKDRIAELQGQIGDTDEAEAGLKKFREELQRTKTASDEAAKAADRLKKARQDTIEGLEQEISALSMVNKANKEGNLTQEEANRLKEEAITLSRLKLSAETEEGQKVLELLRQRNAQEDILSSTLDEKRKKEEEARRAQEEAQSAILKAQEEAAAKTLEFQEGLAGALSSAVTGAQSAEDALKGFILQLSQAIIQAKILEAVQFGMGTTSTGAPTGGGSGGIVQAGIGFLTGAPVFHGGGTVGQPNATRRSVSPSTFIGAPRFHDGLRADEFPAILQKGEEVVPKDQVGRERMAKSNNVTINVTTPNADSFRASQRQISRKMRQETSQI